MNTRRNAASWPQILGTIVLLSAAIAAGAYYFVNQKDGKDAVSREPPSPDFTTAPEGGVKVELPTTPMTNSPAAVPLSDEAAPSPAPAAAPANP